MRNLAALLIVLGACDEPSASPSQDATTATTADTSQPTATEPTDSSVTTASPDASVDGEADVDEPRACPTTFSTGVDDEVVPQTAIQLDPLTVVDTIQWRVSQPTGSASVFRPAHDVPKPTFELNVAGVYEIELNATLDGQACPPIRRTMYVVPASTLHVELLWHTPGDPDETDEGAEAGSDVDLHFAHPLANSPDEDGDGQPDGWFDPRFDAYWFNPSPNWYWAAEANDDPSLDRDDTDGAGPENLNLDVLEPDLCYRIGVHYWFDHGFGPAEATVRVYRDANLVLEVSQTLDHLDLWSVATICEGDVEPPAYTRVCAGTFDACTSDTDCGAATCGPRIHPGYISPLLAPALFH